MDTLKRMSGVYIPPAKLKMLQDGIHDKSSEQYQRLAWERLKKSINGLVNKCNASNLPIIVRELLKENLIRGSGILCQSVLNAQAFGPIFSNVYAALIAVINSKLPNIGKLLLSRLVVRFRKSFVRNEKQSCINTVRFIAHLINQEVVTELLALEMLTILIDNATNDSVEVAVAFLKECGSKLKQSCPKGFFLILDMLRHALNEGNLDTRVQYSIEVVMACAKDNFKDHPIVIPELDLLEEGDKITHNMEVDEKCDTEDHLNVFRFDPDYLENERKYSLLKKEVLDDSDSDSDDDKENGDESGEDEDEDEEEEDEDESNKIIDETGTDLVSLRRKLYLTLQSSIQPEEAAHKLMKLNLQGKERTEMCFTIIDCCAQQRTFIKFYPTIAQNFCSLSNEFVSAFSSIFVDCYKTIHRFQNESALRNVGNFFAFLLYTDSIPWTVLSVIRLNEDDTTSAGRVFIKYLFQEIAYYMGIKRLEERVKDVTLSEALSGIFPRDNPRDTRFSIIFFTQIGLGPLTEDLREFLASKPTVDPVDVKEEATDEKRVIDKKHKKRKREESSSDSSSDSSSESSSGSDSSSDSDSSSSDSDESSSASSSSSDSEPSKASDSRSRDRRGKKDSRPKEKTRGSRSIGHRKRKEDNVTKDKRKEGTVSR